jgi:hypothetical protein
MEEVKHDFVHNKEGGPMHKKTIFLFALILLTLVGISFAQDFAPPTKPVDSLETLNKITGKAKIADDKLMMEFYNGADLNLKSITCEAVVKNLRGHVVKSKQYTVPATDAASSVYYKQGDKNLAFPAFKKLSNCKAAVSTDLNTGIGKRLDWKVIRVEAYTGESEK